MHKRGVVLHCNLENESNTRDQNDIPNHPGVPNPNPIDILDVQRVSTTPPVSRTPKNAPVRKNWSKSDMDSAIKDVEDNLYSIQTAAKK